MYARFSRTWERVSEPVSRNLAAPAFSSTAMPAETSSW